MGRQWVGFQPATRPQRGETVQETAQISTGVTDPRIVALLTTATGLAEWLGAVAEFSNRPGGNLELRDADGAFSGTFAEIDVPRRVVLVTDRHGEIEVRTDVRADPTTVTATITRFIPEGEDATAIRTHLRATLAALEAALR